MRGNGSPKRRKKQRFHHHFDIPALSVNKAWITKGKRYPSGHYSKQKKLMFKCLEEAGYTSGCLNLSGNLKLQMDVGVSSKLSDADNLLKIQIDCLVSFFGNWDDRQIREIHIVKRHVKKGEEYFDMLITKTRRKYE